MENHRKFILTPNKHIIYEKLSEKYKDSEYATCFYVWPFENEWTVAKMHMAFFWIQIGSEFANDFPTHFF